MMPALLLLCCMWAPGDNLARSGVAQSWLPGSQALASAAPALANDGDRLTFWASTLPTEAPPKDVGIAWTQPQTFSTVRLRFCTVNYRPATDGWRLEALVADQWRPLEVRATGTDSEWWTLRCAPVTARAVRLVVTKYAVARPALTEFEVYASEPPSERRRSPLAEAVFWQLYHPLWATTFHTDEALVREVEACHALGFETLILYTLEATHDDLRSITSWTNLAQAAAWSGREPLQAILSATDRLGMTVYLSDLPPQNSLVIAPAARSRRTQQLLYTYREKLLQYVAPHRSVTGYYLNYEFNPEVFAADPGYPAERAADLARFVKRVRPGIKTLQPIGLYRVKRGGDAAAAVTPAELQAFWEPFIAANTALDGYLLIDGVGTTLSDLNHADAAARCLRVLCDRYGKEFWIDTECADFGAGRSYSLDRLQPSLDLAAAHADRIALFEWLSYLSPNTGREPSRRLHDAYAAWRDRLNREPAR